MEYLQNKVNQFVMYLKYVKIVYILYQRIVFFMICVQNLKQRQLLQERIPQNVDPTDPNLSLKAG